MTNSSDTSTLPSSPQQQPKEDNVRVVIRCRPLLEDLEANEEAVVRVDQPSQTIQVNNSRRTFTYDHVFGADSTQDELYDRSARHIVDCVLQGYNGTIFAYGQTGTGKTFTSSGISERSFEHIFEHIGASAGDHKFLVRASFYEIYNEEIRDLLVVAAKDGKSPAKALPLMKKKGPSGPANRSLKLKETKEGAVVIKDLSYFVVNSVEDLKRLKAAGDRQRACGATKMNQRSSRSHTIFTITIETTVVSSKALDKKSSSKEIAPLAAVRVGKFHLIDLAGSERQAKTGTTGTRLKEASNINLSLTSLSLVIAALTDPKAKFVPYRNSKLTRILSDSLGGNSKTLLIACIGPAKVNLDETLSTLRFASQAKAIRNKPVINEDSKDTLLRQFQQQLAELQAQLESEGGGNSGGSFEESSTLDQGGGKSHHPPQPKKVIPPELMDRLRSLEASIIVGGENLIEKAELQQKLIEESEAELAARRAKEAQLAAELQSRQAELLQMEDGYATLQEEVVALNRKLKKAYGFLKESRAEYEDAAVEVETLRSELLDSIRTAEKEIKLTNALVEYYVPGGEQLAAIEANCSYNQSTGDWELRCLAYTGNNMKVSVLFGNEEFL